MFQQITVQNFQSKDTMHLLSLICISFLVINKLLVNDKILFAAIDPCIIQVVFQSSAKQFLFQENTTHEYVK